MWCSWQGPRLLLGKRTSAGRRAKCRAVGLVGCITLVIKRVVWGESGKPPSPQPHWAIRRRGSEPVCVDAPGRRAGAQRAAARSICPARASVPRAPDLQSVTLPAERLPRKRTPPAPPIQSVNAKWSKLTRRQSPWLQVGEAPYSLHSPASMQPRGASFRRACMQKSRPLDHRNYPIDIARGPVGAGSPSNASLTRRSRPFVRAAPPSPATAPAADRRSLSGAFTPPDPRPPGL